MSFFSSSSPAPAPSAFGSTNPSGGSTPAFSFGSAPAPATGTSNLFGGTSTTTTAPAPASGFSFGGASSGTANTAAPTPSAFGQSTTGFGVSSAPSTFGAPQPAPAPGFGFGATAPAPAFGAPAPAFGAPAPGFGAPSPAFGAPAPAFGAPAPAFGAPSPAAPQQQQQSQKPITGQTPYSELPPEYKNAIDSIHQAMMHHKRIMYSVETMSPALLRGGGPDNVGGLVEEVDPNVQPLPVQLASMESQLKTLQQSMDTAHIHAQDIRRQFETSTVSSVRYGLWPMEAVATRRNIKLSKHAASSSGISQKATSEVKEQIQKSLDQQAAHVDRLEQMPSPYFWNVMQDFSSRIVVLQEEIKALESNLSLVVNMYNSNTVVDVAGIVQAHANKLAQLTDKVSHVHREMENLRANYSRSVQNTNQVNVLEQARTDEYLRKQRVELNSQAYIMKAAPTSNAPPAPAPASTSTSTFGTSTTTSGFGFGSTTPAPAPSTGGLFGGAASSTTSFGAASTPAAAPQPGGGGLFGAASTTPAPATGSNLFGASSTTPAPSPTGAPARLFGAAPAPAGHGIFGATPGTATSNVGGGFTFGGSTASTPKAKSNKSRPRR
jgi:hypothetical protein